MSVATMPIDAAKIAVNPPTYAMTVCTSAGAASTVGKKRASR